MASPIFYDWLRRAQYIAPFSSFAPENYQFNPIYGVSVNQAGASAPAVSQKLAYLWVKHSQFGEGI